MGKLQERTDADVLKKAPLRLTCDAAGLWSVDGVTSLGTTATSGIYNMKPGDQLIIAISAAADAAAILVLPGLQEAAGKFYYISAPTGAAGGDISVYEKETGTELATYGDLDADDDHFIIFSDGIQWRIVLDGVA
jgi:hypothetical protein